MKRFFSGIFVCAFLMGWLSGVASASLFPYIENDISGSWQTFLIQEAVENAATEDDLMSDERIRINDEIAFRDTPVSAKAELEWRYQTFDGFDSQSRADWDIRQMYVQYDQDDYSAALGWRIVSWGKMDDTVILDRMVPQDLTHFVLYDKEQRKKPALMLWQEWAWDEDLRLEVVAEPYFESSDVDFFGTNYAVFDHLKQAVENGPYTNAQKTATTSIATADYDRTTDRSFHNAQAGLRLRGRKEGLDWGLYYLNVYQSTPTLRERTATGNLVKQFLYDPSVAYLNAVTAAGASGDDYILDEYHPRVNIIGADWETVAGTFGLRGEAALLFGLPYLRRDFSYTEKDQLSLGLGIDHTTESQWYFDAQYMQDVVFQYEDLYAAEQYPYYFTGTIRKDFLRGIITMETDWMWNASYGDWMINPEMTYTYDPVSAHISVGVFVFQDGNSSTLLGRYDKNDVIYLKIGGNF